MHIVCMLMCRRTY